MTVIRALLRRRTAQRDAGVSMAEMLVVTAILGVVLAIVQGAAIASQKTTSSIAFRYSTAQQARVAVDTITRNLRTAVLPQLLTDGSCSACSTSAFVQGTPTSVQFFANNNADPARSGPTRVTYMLQPNGDLVETIQKPEPHPPDVYSFVYCDPSSPTCRPATRVIARGVVVPPGSRLFTYYDRAGSAMTAGVLNAAQLSAVDSVDVHLRVTEGGEHVTLTQRVSLPNADTVPDTTED